MKKSFFYSQRNHALRNLRSLSGYYLKLKESASSNADILYHIGTKIKSILQFLKRRTSKKIIQQSMGSTFTVVSLFLSSGVMAQNFADAVPITQLNTSPIIAPKLVDIDEDGDLDVIGIGFDFTAEEVAPFTMENFGDKYNFALGGIDFNNPAISLPFDNCRYLWSLDVADMDADGDLDIITLSYTDDNQIVYFFENIGDGTYLEAKSVGEISRLELSYATSVTLVDIDNDGDFDLLTAGVDEVTYAAGRSEFAVAIIENTGNKDSLALNSVSFPNNFPKLGILDATFLNITNQVVTGDFDSDGDSDIVFFVPYNDNVIPEPLYYENINGGYRFTGVLEQFTQEESFFLATSGDIDGDGDIDLLYNNLDVVEYLDAYRADFFYIENDLLSSVDKVELDGKFSFLQNPLESELVLEANGILPGNYNLSVYNAIGQMMISQQRILVEDNIVEMNVTELTTGNYFLKMTSDIGAIALRFIKQ